MKKKIQDLLSRTRNPHEIQRHFDNSTEVKISDIQSIMIEGMPEVFGWGRVSLQPYIISRRTAWIAAWPAVDAQVIIQHKRLHDQGKVTMCQGRDGDYIIQYAIPSKRRLHRAAYFFGG